MKRVVCCGLLAMRRAHRGIRRQPRGDACPMAADLSAVRSARALGCDAHRRTSTGTRTGTLEYGTTKYPG